jgi:GMP synthase (glutamine-hydrolysing)
MEDKILLVVHQETSNPGRVGRQLRARGYMLDVRRPSGGDELPATMDDHAGAVIFGGPMSANDDHLDYVRQEIDWITTVLESGKPFLGICLGAQMMVRNLGGGVYLHPQGQVEIGYHPLRPAAKDCDIFPAPSNFYQWHKEGFDLPAGAELLATGETFAHQAFRLGNAYGIQFHPEVTFGMMKRWLTNAAHMLEFPGAQSHEDQIRARRRYEGPTVRWLESFLDIWLESGPAQHPGSNKRAGVDGRSLASGARDFV